MTFDFKEFEW